MLIISATGILLVALFGYVLSLSANNELASILLFIFLLAAIVFILLVLAAQVAWKLLPAKYKEKYKIKRGRCNALIIISIPLLLIGADGINRNFLSHSSAMLRISGNLGMLIFDLFLLWNLIKQSRWRKILLGSVAFALFITALNFIGSVTSTPSEIRHPDSTQVLATLGYVDWVPVESESELAKSGVVKHEISSACAGLNLYHSRTLSEAQLIDMDGNIVHKWAGDTGGDDTWHHVELCENGNLMVISKERMLVMLDWDSNIKWKSDLRFHHDASVGEDGRIYALAKEDECVFWCSMPLPVLNDYVVVMSANGTIEKKISVYPALKKDNFLPNPNIAYRIQRWVLKPRNLKNIIEHNLDENHPCQDGGCYFDLTHSNSIAVMDKDIKGFCKKGDLLISIRELNMVAVMNPQTQRFVWSWGRRELDKQHHATLLDNNNVLIFDNGTGRGFTRVVEVSPVSREIAWQYKSDPAGAFFSRKRGACQRLPNGNTLITESDKGHVFEVTAQGRVVWEFYNPDVRSEDKTRGAIYRMIRFFDFERPNL